MESHLIPRLELIIKSIQYKQRDLKIRLIKLSELINKKKLTIHSFTAYIQEYEKNLYLENNLSVANFINKQMFFKKVAHLVTQETDALEELYTKRKAIQQEYAANIQKVDVIKESIVNATKQKVTDRDKIIDQLDQEAFNCYVSQLKI